MSLEKRIQDIEYNLKRAEFQRQARENGRVTCEYFDTNRLQNEQALYQDILREIHSSSVPETVRDSSHRNRPRDFLNDSSTQKN